MQLAHEGGACHTRSTSLDTGKDPSMPLSALVPELSGACMGLPAPCLHALTALLKTNKCLTYLLVVSTYMVPGTARPPARPSARACHGMSWQVRAAGELPRAVVPVA